MGLCFYDPETGEIVFTLEEVAQAKVIGYYPYRQACIQAYPLGGGEGDTEQARTDDRWNQIQPILKAWSDEMSLWVDNKAGYVIELSGNQFLLHYKDGNVWLGPLSEATTYEGEPLKNSKMVPYAFDSSGLQVMNDFLETHQAVFKQFSELLQGLSLPRLVRCDTCTQYLPVQGCLSLGSGEDSWYQCYDCNAKEEWKEQLLTPDWKIQMGKALCKEWKTNPILHQTLNKLVMLRTNLPNESLS